MKQVAHRNEQFERIAELKASYRAAGNPVVSMDTKKKEQIGNFYRDGSLYTTAAVQTFDHDFTSFSQGVVIPHAIYDLHLNQGFINIGISRDTSEFACDSLRHWWDQKGRFDYPHATSILVLCDGGGSNSARHYIFKQDLQSLVDEIGVEIRIAHYPPYCSKYNPVNTGSSLMSPVPAKASSSLVSSWFANSSPRPILDKAYLSRSMCSTRSTKPGAKPPLISKTTCLSSSMLSCRSGITLPFLNPPDSMTYLIATPNLLISNNPTVHSTSTPPYP